MQTVTAKQGRRFKRTATRTGRRTRLLRRARVFGADEQAARRAENRSHRPTPASGAQQPPIAEQVTTLVAMSLCGLSVFAICFFMMSEINSILSHFGMGTLADAFMGH